MLLAVSLSAVLRSAREKRIIAPAANPCRGHTGLSCSLRTVSPLVSPDTNKIFSPITTGRW